MHVRAALRNGLTHDEIKEVLLQCGDLLRRAGREPRVRDRAAGARRSVRRGAHAGRDRRRRPGGPDARAAAPPAGIESVVLEDRSRDYVEARIRAGVLEQGTVDAARAGRRRASGCEREGIVHGGIHLQFDGERHHVPLSELTGGRRIVIYGQTEVVKDLIAARLDAGLPLHVRGGGRRRARLRGRRAVRHVRPRRRGAATRLRRHRRLRRLPRRLPPGDRRTSCAPSRASTRSAGSASSPRSPPSSDELVYAHHARGFALLSLRSPTLSRLYLQCRPDEDLDEWPDERIWEELQTTHRARRLDARRGAGAREGRHGHAQLRRRADAARAALPRRRRGAHRPADRREGTESRDRTTCASSPTR